MLCLLMSPPRIKTELTCPETVSTRALPCGIVSDSPRL
jgi:hypothetical protein